MMTGIGILYTALKLPTIAAVLVLGRLLSDRLGLKGVLWGGAFMSLSMVVGLLSPVLHVRIIAVLMAGDVTPFGYAAMSDAARGWGFASVGLLLAGPFLTYLLLVYLTFTVPSNQVGSW